MSDLVVASSVDYRRLPSTKRRPLNRSSGVSVRAGAIVSFDEPRLTADVGGLGVTTPPDTRMERERREGWREACIRVRDMSSPPQNSGSSGPRRAHELPLSGHDATRRVGS
jgi:hypothetical protein